MLNSNRGALTLALFSMLSSELAGQRVRPIAEPEGRQGEIETAIPRIEPELEAFLGSDAPVDVFVVLGNQPQEAIARKHMEPVRRELGWLQEQVAAQLRSRGPMDPKLASIVKRRDELELQARRSAIREIQAASASAQEAMAARLETAGAAVGRRFWIFNMMEARVPGRLIPVIADWPGVLAVKMAHQRNTMIEASVPGTGIGKFWEAGYMGNTQTVLVLDSGINAAHPWFNNLSVIARVSLQSASKRACFDDDASDTRDRLNHGTAVAGIIGSRSPKGMLPELGQVISMKVVAKAKNTAGCPQMLIEEADWVAGIEAALADFPVQVVNVSLGGGPGTEDDLACWIVDRLAVMFDLSIFVAAGNDGESPRYYQVASPAAAYNGIAVAAVDGNRTATRLDNSPASFSSKGPTPLGRAKPDIACPGVRIISADGLSDGPSKEISGTSFASPHCAGIGAALADAGIKSALARKALLINSTDSPDWTRTVGFGEANAERVFENRNNVITNTLRLSGGRYVWLYAADVRGTGRATMVWNRHIRSMDAAANRASWYLANLDITVYDGNSGRQVATSDRGRDNVETFALRGTGQAIVKVHPVGTIADADEEPFAIAYSGGAIRPVRAPFLEVSCVPERNSVMMFGILNIECAIHNTGEIAVQNSEAALTYLDPWSQRPVSVNLEALAAGGRVTKRISLKPLAGARLGMTTLQFAGVTRALGETWEGEQGSAQFQVMPAVLQDCTPQYSVNAVFPLSANRQTFTVDVKFPRYNPQNPGVCKWSADPGGFVTVVNSVGSGVSMLTGAGDKQLTFVVSEAPKRPAGTAPRQASITIRITSDMDERNAPAPSPVNPPIVITVTQRYAQ